ncbi:hypothetical protein CesoFtcFv8_022140 [Champsocephalus esox]|uniref:Uncharacterized protein n=1 Tax=Champsocephalus esox TaxID=159716 RepID=A0AAN8BAK2_9TELE|nr:hypothetical protein CesoFtcFv8_022140 [Champsocephalus esox]
MILHSLMHAGLSSKKAAKGDGHRKRHEWIERDLKKEGHWQGYKHPGCSFYCDKDYCAAARGLAPLPADGVGSGFLQLLHMLLEKLWGRVWSSKGMGGTLKQVPVVRRLQVLRHFKLWQKETAFLFRCE